MATAKFVILLCILVHVFEVKCGSRIVGGTDALPGSAPYMVSLRSDTFFHFCGGGLIDAEWVVTAKHCVDGSGTINVAAGSNTLDPRNVVIPSRSIHVHPENDIALVKLSRRIQFNNLIQPLNLPSSDLDGNFDMRITGWGDSKFENNEASDVPNNLQSLNVLSISTNDCRWYYGDSNIINERDLCVLGPIGQGICYGDSGSPLVTNNEVHAVASRVIPCAGNYPDIYTKVFYHNSWIRDTMARN